MVKKKNKYNKGVKMAWQDNYEMVEDRLKKFWADYPNGRIDTQVVHITDDGTCVTIKAEIFTGEEGEVFPVTSGIAQETKGQGGFANEDAWVENCETSAIGRALANYKYQGSGKARPSVEEMSKVKKGKQPPMPTKNKEKDIAQGDGKKATPPSSTSPVQQIKDAGFGNREQDKHSNGKLAMDDTGLLCPCDKQCTVNYIPTSEKRNPKGPDFRCSMMGQCVGGDTVDGKVFAKSWWMDNKQTPESWKDFAAVSNGMKLPDIKTLDKGDIPF